MTIEELYDKQNADLDRRKQLDNRIYCCTAAGCISCGAESVKKSIADQVKSAGMAERIEAWRAQGP